MGHACLLFFARLVPVGVINGARYFSATIFANLTGLMANVIEMKTVEPIFAKYTFTDLQHTNFVKTSFNENIASEISLANVSFSYDHSEQPIIEHLTYQFATNNKYAIVGKSGVGKSTILNILTGRIAPLVGQVYLNGVAYSKLDSATLNENIVYITQNPHIFSASLNFNITLGADEDDELMERALKFSGIDATMSIFADGLQTMIDQSGRHISGGQRERIAIARGVYQNKRIWLVDEATASLDQKSAYDIESALLAMTDITLIVVSHHFARPDFLETVDGVIDLNQSAEKRG